MAIPAGSSRARRCETANRSATSLAVSEARRAPIAARSSRSILRLIRVAGSGGVTGVCHRTGLTRESVEAGKCLWVQDLQENRGPPALARVGPAKAGQTTGQGLHHHGQAVTLVAYIHATQGQDGSLGFFKKYARIATWMAVSVHHPLAGQQLPFLVQAVGQTVGGD